MYPYFEPLIVVLGLCLLVASVCFLNLYSTLQLLFYLICNRNFCPWRRWVGGRGGRSSRSWRQTGRGRWAFSYISVCVCEILCTSVSSMKNNLFMLDKIYVYLGGLMVKLLLPCVFSECSSVLWNFAKGGWQLSLQQICVPSQIPRRLKGLKDLLAKVCPKISTCLFRACWRHLMWFLTFG